MIVCNFNGTIEGLKSAICKRTGIPPQAQRLYYGSKLLTDGTISNVPKCCNINLLLGLLGGGKHCDVCYENGEYMCQDCEGKFFCGDCCTKIHKHPDRRAHSPKLVTNNEHCTEVSAARSEEDEILNMDDYDISDTPETSLAFEEANMVMTLAERFNLTRFKQYQKEVIQALLSGRDCLVVQPTGSGKSLCFKYPAVRTNMKSIVITPTISLMQDQVKKL